MASRARRAAEPALGAFARFASPDVRRFVDRSRRHPRQSYLGSPARRARLVEYGVERLSSLARERGAALAVLPGEDRDDPRLDAASSLPPDELQALLRYF